MGAGPTKTATYSGSGGSVQSAEVTFTLSDIPGSQIVRFETDAIASPPYPVQPPPSENTVALNGQLSIYPPVLGYLGLFLVPFPADTFTQTPAQDAPGTVFQNCFNLAGLLPGCVSRLGSGVFPGLVIARYQANGFPIPASPECHHIHPLGFGGSNDVRNGVPLSHTSHGYFNAWWRNVNRFGFVDPAVTDTDCS